MLRVAASGEDDEDENSDDEDDDDEPVRKTRKKGKGGGRYVGGSGSTTSGSSGGGRKGSGKKSSKSRRELPTGAVAILKQWLLSAEHFTHPYPTAQDQQHLMAVTGIDKKQLKNWFTNARRRIWKPMMKKQMEAHKVPMPMGNMAIPHHHQHGGMAGNPFAGAAPPYGMAAHNGGAGGQPGHHHAAQQMGQPQQHGGMGMHHPPPQPAHGMGLSFTSFDDLFKTFMPQEGGAGGQAGGATGQAGGAGHGMQPGMHPLMKTFSSKSFSNLRTASLTDFPRTDSYAFLEVFFNDEGLQDGLNGEPMDNIGLSMDEHETSSPGGGGDGTVGMKRAGSGNEDMTGGPPGKRLAASGHISFANPATVQMQGMHMVQQQQEQQHGLVQHRQGQAPPQQQQQQQQLTVTAPNAFYGANNGGFQRPGLSPRMRGNQQGGGMIRRSSSSNFAAAAAAAAEQQQQQHRAGSPMPPHPQHHQHHAQPQQQPQQQQSAVHVSSAARCPFCPELNVDTQLRPCGHLFHGNCLKPWLQEAQGIPGCPVCRVPISSCVLAVPCINNNSSTAGGFPHQPQQLPQQQELKPEQPAGFY